MNVKQYTIEVGAPFSRTQILFGATALQWARTSSFTRFLRGLEL